MVFLPNWLSTERNQGTRQVEYHVWLTLLLSEQAKMKPRLKSSLLPWPRLWQAWWLCSAGLRKCGGQTWLAQASRQSHARCTEGGFLFIRVTYFKKMVFCILWSARLLCKADRVLDPTEYSACVLCEKGGVAISFTLFRSRGFIILLASSFRFSVTVLGFWGLLRLVNYHVSDSFPHVSGSCYPRRRAV